MSALRRVAIALALVLSAAPAGAVERIIQFVSDVTVERNGDLVVTETIRVEAEGREIRRGILRDFPTVYTRPDGSRVEVGFHVESVIRNSQTESFTTERMSNGVRIRIGSADRTLNRGQHTYVIRYRTTRQIGFFGDYDELYWNATGTGWTFPIDQAEARITLPEKVPFRQSAVYTGPQGARGKDATVVEQQPGRIVFRTTRPLPAKNGLTVAAAWEKGVVTPPTSGQQASYWLLDNRPVVVAVLGLVLLLAYYGFAFMTVGRDPQSGTIIPLFGPPQGMSPAATRYVDRMGFDDRCFTAGIIGLGVKGHLKVVESENSSRLEKRSGGQALTPDEQGMQTRLFSSGPTIELQQSNHLVLGRAKDGLHENLKDNYLGKLFANNYAWSTIGLALALALMVAVFFAMGAVNRGGPIVVLVFTMPVMMAGAAMTFSAWQRSLGGGWLLIGGIVIVAIAVGATLFFGWAIEPGLVNQVTSGALLAACAVAGIGFLWLKAPSKSGRRIMDNIEGFRQYLGVAEEDRLNALNPPDKTPELFEKFLPYAVALDVQNAWAAKFAGVLAAAGAAAATGWYVGSRDWHNDPVSFADHIGSSLATTIASASTAPGSSGNGGSGGGGSSGGGGGGGGGSGW